MSEFRSFDISMLFQVITLTITLVAFFAAVDYFTSQVSLEIRLLPDSPKVDVWYYSDTMHAFYAENNLDIPETLHTSFWPLLMAAIISMSGVASPISM